MRSFHYNCKESTFQIRWHSQVLIQGRMVFGGPLLDPLHYGKTQHFHRSMWSYDIEYHWIMFCHSIWCLRYHFTAVPSEGLDMTTSYHETACFQISPLLLWNNVEFQLLLAHCPQLIITILFYICLISYLVDCTHEHKTQEVWCFLWSFHYTAFIVSTKND